MFEIVLGPSSQSDAATVLLPTHANFTLAVYNLSLTEKFSSTLVLKFR